MEPERIFLKIIYTFGNSRRINYDFSTTFEAYHFTEDALPAYFFTAGGLYQAGFQSLAADDEDR